MEDYNINNDDSYYGETLGGFRTVEDVNVLSMLERGLYYRLMKALWGEDYIPLNDDDWTSMRYFILAMLFMLSQFFLILRFLYFANTNKGTQRSVVRSIISKRMRKMIYLEHNQSRKKE